MIGSDAFAEMGEWREPEAVFALTHIAVMTRPPVASGSLHDWLPKCVGDSVELATDGRSGRHRKAGKWLRSVEILALDVSASGVRQRLRDGRCVRYLLPEPVRAAVEKSGVYSGA